MKSILYEILTQIIIFFAKMREDMKYDTHYRYDRIAGFDWIKGGFQTPEFKGHSNCQWRCCDCGLGHRMWFEDNISFALPIRPPKYKYKLRYTAYKGTYASKEMIEKMKAFKEEK